MKLLSLRLENFRSFETCELDLDCEGLVGISGPNGSGKSTLLEAINYALYGRGRGPRTPKPERDGAGPKAKCEVELEFVHDERACRIVRGPHAELLEVDRDKRIDGGGQEALTKAVSELLGVGKNSFGTTFYARQSEVQALNNPKNRQKELEALLGIDQVRDAYSDAADAVREQKAAVRALDEGLPCLEEAEKDLEQAENEAREKAPAVESAAKAQDLAQQVRDSAWQKVTTARARAEEVFELDGKAAIATSELESAQEKVKESERALAEAESAATEAEALKEEAGRVEELEARERAHGLEQQAAERAETVRNQRREAEAKAVEAVDELAAVEDQRPAIDSSQKELADAREELEQITARLLALPTELNEARRDAADALLLQRSTKAAQDLDEELALLAPLRDETEVRTKKVAGLEAEATQLATRLGEERSHLAHVQEDGPNAMCPRCKRSYGEDYETIVTDFESALADMERRNGEIAGELNQLREEATEAKPKLDRLRAAESERAGVEPTDQALEVLEEIAATAAGRVEVLEAEELDLTERRKALTAGVTELDVTLSQLRAQQKQRDELEARRDEAEKARDLYQQQLEEIGDSEYDENAHKRTSAALSTARIAANRCAELRAQAGQCELLKARRDAAISDAELAEKKHEEAKAAAAARESDKQAQERAEEAYEAAREALDSATEALAEAKEQALEESAAVETARASLKNAKRQAGQLKKARRELLLRELVSAALEAYRADMQQQAVPSLAQETADLLRSVTRGRYSDVQISADGELELIDRGEPYGLGRFSGGEKDIANLCLRIGLSKVLARRTGTETGFIILDEVLGSQDRDRRSALVQALRELDQEFGQVFVVSHFDDFMEHCSLQIEVELVDGTSRARIIPA
ncbi:MAG TPA: SMC family ATPase [Solirubrobacterales bacterium]|jgi:exonuclease SbcC|nr:SMC family ATPase [Solirubrobacterales bacterium]